ncbi:SpoIIE family protein phosphatase [Streptomyces sp. enrichment culture]|uniref:ATP-binding SpoIIE family protein phosphatase n=1 Tax=Streptomyces sp. enrichment culture TaxID=1795815 RepID=UPI003F56A4FE
MAVIDDRGVVVEWSQAAERVLHLPASAVIGRSILRFLDQGPAGAEAAGRPGGMSVAEGTARLSSPSGHTATVRYQAHRLPRSRQTLVLAVDADRATDTEQARELLRALLAQSRIGLVLRDVDLAVVRSNIGSAAFAGPALPVGSRLSDVMSAQDADSAEAALRDVLETGVPMAAREQHVRSSRGPRAEWSFSVSAVRTEDAHGRPTGVGVLLTDATQYVRATRRRELRHRASAEIGGSLDVLRTAQEIVDVLVPSFGDLVWVDLAEAVPGGEEPTKSLGGGDLHLRRAAVRSAQGGWPPALLQPGAVVPNLPDVPVARELQAGRSLVVDREALEKGFGGPAQVRLTVPERGRFLAIAPLHARGLLLGIVGVWRLEGSEPYDRGDVELLTEIAAHSALGVDNARRYTREHRSAVALQRRLLPQPSIRTSSMETLGSYVPAAGGAEVGGDWFDTIELPSLRTALVVGDVTGHGLHATATMGRLRTAVQTLALLELSPDELLIHLDEMVARLAAEADAEVRDTVGATCLIAVHDAVTGRCTLASAGHPPLIVATPDGGVAPVAVRPGPPLGVGGLPFEATSVDVPPGSVLALYTDGLFEGRPADVDGAVRDLAGRLSRLLRSGCALDSMARALLAGSEQTPRRDDAALLIARPSALDADAVAHWEFPADPAAVSRARDAATGKLTQWGMEDSAFVTELIVSELVTNAVRYAGGPVGLRLIRAEVLICEVSDPSNTQPRMRRARTTDEGGRGLFLVAQLSRRWGSRYGASGKTIWTEQEIAA